jgi:hypothetical protein
MNLALVNHCANNYPDRSRNFSDQFTYGVALKFNKTGTLLAAGNIIQKSSNPGQDTVTALCGCTTSRPRPLLFQSCPTALKSTPSRLLNLPHLLTLRSFSNNGRLLASCSKDKDVVVFDIVAATALWRHTYDSCPHKVEFIPSQHDNLLLVSLSFAPPQVVNLKTSESFELPPPPEEDNPTASVGKQIALTAHAL